MRWLDRWNSGADARVKLQNFLGRTNSSSDRQTLQILNQRVLRGVQRLNEYLEFSCKRNRHVLSYWLLSAEMASVSNFSFSSVSRFDMMIKRDPNTTCGQNILIVQLFLLTLSLLRHTIHFKIYKGWDWYVSQRTNTQPLMSGPPELDNVVQAKLRGSQ